MMSVAKLPYDDAEDGISLTISVLPSTLGTEEEQIFRAVNGLDAYFASNGFHLNLSVLNRDTLRDAMDNPDKYPQLTIRDGRTCVAGSTYLRVWWGRQK